MGAFGAAACNDFLTARNPGAVEEISVNQPRYLGLLVDGIVGEFQLANTNVTGGTPSSPTSCTTARPSSRRR
jgi:hypothetical protein